MTNKRQKIDKKYLEITCQQTILFVYHHNQFYLRRKIKKTLWFKKLLCCNTGNQSKRLSTLTKSGESRGFTLTGNIVTWCVRIEKYWELFREGRYSLGEIYWRKTCYSLVVVVVISPCCGHRMRLTSAGSTLFCKQLLLGAQCPQHTTSSGHFWNEGGSATPSLHHH